MAKKKNNQPAVEEATEKLRVIALGGLGEVGKNITAFEYGDDIMLVDCGVSFPDEEMLGVDLVIPDFSYLEKNEDKIRGLVITHGHEDHVGSIPYFLKKVNVPIYGTPLTLGIVEHKLSEASIADIATLKPIQGGDKFKLGVFGVEAISVTHSIADAVAYAISTPVGTVIVTGDFKVDLTPIDGHIDLARFGELGNKGVLLLMSDSTNAERPGSTLPERVVGESLEAIFNQYKDKRIVITTFSSNVHRVQQIINASIHYGRKVALTGRSMLNVIDVATRLGYIHVPEGLLISIDEINRYNPEQITIITTGTQGEHMSALYRMAFAEHSKVKLGPSDVVIFSASAIPGNEKFVGKVINELMSNGIKVLHSAIADVHVSGHACQEDLKLMLHLTKPKFFVPMHGEYRQLKSHADLAAYMGIPAKNILISENGKIIELDKKTMKHNGSVTSGKVLVDGYGVGDVGNIVLRDRRLLSEEGLIIIVMAIDANDGLLMSGPDLVSRGFVYVRESEELMEEAKMIVSDAVIELLDSGNYDMAELKTRAKDVLSKFMYQKTGRRPMILPITVNV